MLTLFCHQDFDFYLLIIFLINETSVDLDSAFNVRTDIMLAWSRRETYASCITPPT